MLETIFSWQAVRVLMWVLYVPSCLGLIGIVLLQKGKGAGFAGAFGMGAGSEAVFGPRASKSLPVRLTYVMSVIFVVLAFSLSVVQSRITSGSAPELITSDEMAESAESQALDDMGLGSKYSDEASGAAATPAAATPAPAAETPAPAEATPAPAAETPAPAAAPEEAAN